MLSPKLEVSIISLPSELREPYRRGVKSVRSGGVRAHQEDKELSVNMIDAHMNSQRLREHAKGMHGSAPVGVLELKEIDACTHPNPEAIPR